MLVVQKSNNGDHCCYNRCCNQRQTINNHMFVCMLLCWLFGWLLHSSIHSFVRSFVRTFVGLLFVRSFVRSFVCCYCKIIVFIVVILVIVIVIVTVLSVIAYCWLLYLVWKTDGITTINNNTVIVQRARECGTCEPT